jgi:hypothetical protein
MTCWRESPGSNSAITVRIAHTTSDGRPRVKVNDVVGLFKGSFTSNHASQRQDEVSTREKSPCVNLRGYDEVIRPT